MSIKIESKGGILYSSSETHQGKQTILPKGCGQEIWYLHCNNRATAMNKKLFNVPGCSASQPEGIGGLQPLLQAFLLLRKAPSPYHNSLLVCDCEPGNGF